MIKALRVDDNLLHGQIAFSWVKGLQLHGIVVADDKIVNDSFMKMTLGLAKPPGVNLKIVSVNDAIDYLSNMEDDIHVMVIVNTLKNAQRITIAIKEIYSINLGLLRTNLPVFKQFEHVSLSKEDISICNLLMESGIEIELRLRYTDSKVMLKPTI